jgi:hypothetical protein
VGERVFRLRHMHLNGVCLLGKTLEQAIVRSADAAVEAAPSAVVAGPNSASVRGGSIRLISDNKDADLVPCFIFPPSFAMVSDFS